MSGGFTGGPGLVPTVVTGPDGHSLSHHGYHLCQILIERARGVVTLPRVIPA